MNRMLLTSMVVMLTFISCSDKKTATKDPVPEPQVKAAAQVDPVAQKLEALKKAEPTDMGEMQKKLPEEMAGIKRSNFAMNSNLGYAIVEADYEKSSKNYLHLVLYDCTGEQGADLYKNSYQSYLGKTEANAEGYTKTIDFNGRKAVERFDAANKITTLSFMTNDKILVVLSGKDIPVETLKVEALKL
jgi:Skp family chaperone for outer membrane proteins